MKKIFHYAALILASGALIFTVPDASARRPGISGNSPTQSTSHRPSSARPGASRPENNSRPPQAGNTTSRPGTRPGIGTGNNTPTQGFRPNGDQNQGNGHNPGFGHDHGNNHNPGPTQPGTRPGATTPFTRPGAVNPGFGNQGSMRPGNQRPGGNYPGGYQPGGNRPVQPGWGNIGPSFAQPVPPPQRPFRPVMRPVPRPSRPMGWIPTPGLPAINIFPGLSFGVGLSVSLNFLNNGGYSVDGYSDNTVYLRDVNELSMIWPDAALYYNNLGRLESSSFYYSTPYNDFSRYNQAYSRLCATYGTPASSGASTATWFGSSGYITLSYTANVSSSGAMRYYTTLSYGM